MGVKSEMVLQHKEFLERLEKLTELTSELGKLGRFKPEGGEAKKNWDSLIKKRHELTGQLTEELTEISGAIGEKDITLLLSGADQLLEMINHVQMDLRLWADLNLIE